MSYSRWGSSSWYTFWNDSSGDDRDSQVLSAWYSMGEEDCIDWQYWELDDLMKESFDDIIKHIMTETCFSLSVVFIGVCFHFTFYGTSLFFPPSCEDIM